MWYRIETTNDKIALTKRGLTQAAIVLDRRGINYRVRVSNKRKKGFTDDGIAAREVYLFIDYSSPQQETFLTIVLDSCVKVSLIDSLEGTKLPDLVQMHGWNNVYSYTEKRLTRGTCNVV